jgi:hypothetical protein
MCRQEISANDAKKSEISIWVENEVQKVKGRPPLHNMLYDSTSQCIISIDFMRKAAPDALLN